MTEEERRDIGLEFCAKGLRYTLHRFNYFLSYEEKAAIVGAICLLRDKSDNWYLQPSDESWKQELDVVTEE